MPHMKVELQALQAAVGSLTPGPLGIHDIASVEPLLATAWGSISGSDDCGMQDSKIDGRLESVEWHPVGVPTRRCSLAMRSINISGPERATSSTPVADQHEGSPVQRVRKGCVVW